MTGAAYVRKAVWVNPPSVGGHNSKASSVLKPCSTQIYNAPRLTYDPLRIKCSRGRKRGVVDTSR
jgi:hypothetical protein